MAAWLNRLVEWGFVIYDRRHDGFQFSFPSEWDRIESQTAGQFETTNGLFTFDTISPHDAADIAKCDLMGEEHEACLADSSFQHEWKNVSWIRPEQLRTIRMAGAAQLSAWNLIGVLLLGSGTWGLSRWFTRRFEMHVQALKEKELLESTLLKYLPTDVCNRLLNEPSKYGQLGGASQDVAVLFANIRGFTSFAEEHDPQYIVSVLNRALTDLVTPVRVFHGILDKYIDNGFLAFFEPKAELADAAQRAVDAAKMMQAASAICGQLRMPLNCEPWGSVSVSVQAEWSWVMWGLRMRWITPSSGMPSMLRRGFRPWRRQARLSSPLQLAPC